METLVEELVLFLGAENPDAFLSHAHQSLINIQLSNCRVLAILERLVGSQEEAGFAGAVTAVNKDRSNGLFWREE